MSVLTLQVAVCLCLPRSWPRAQASEAFFPSRGREQCLRPGAPSASGSTTLGGAQDGEGRVKGPGQPARVDSFFQLRSNGSRQEELWAFDLPFLQVYVPAWDRVAGMRNVDEGGDKTRWVQPSRKGLDHHARAQMKKEKTD